MCFYVYCFARAHFSFLETTKQKFMAAYRFLKNRILITDEVMFTQTSTCENSCDPNAQLCFKKIRQSFSPDINNSS